MRTTSKFVKRRSLMRYVLWALMAQTAFANRRYYRMFTTWLPHFLTNTIALLLPDVLRRVFSAQRKPRNIIEDVLLTTVRDNPDYVTYIAPLTIGYIVSHPRFNIYKGDLAQIRFAGFGLDAIPHGATAFALSSLIVSILNGLRDRNSYGGLLARVVRWGSQKPELVTFAILAALTAFWEAGEYQMHNYEMSIHGNAEAINMQWSVEDTARDVLINMLGCLAALWLHKQSQSSARDRLLVSSDVQ